MKAITLVKLIGKLSLPKHHTELHLSTTSSHHPHLPCPSLSISLSHRPSLISRPSTSPTRRSHYTDRGRRYYRMATDLPKLQDVTKVSTSIIRVLGGNPGKFQLQGTNTYILGTGSSRLLLDTAQGFPHWKTQLQKTLQEESIEISTCLLSHWHHDHISGVGDLKTLCPSVKIHKHLGNSYDPDRNLQTETIHDIRDGERFHTLDQTFELEALHCPGHARDHMAFLITRTTDPDELGCIFTADNVLGHGTAVFEDLATYLASLALMRSRVDREKRRAFPGHGEVVADARAKIEEYIDHRRMREEEALHVLRFGDVERPERGVEVVAGKRWESMEMVRVIYRKYPEQLWVPAERGLVLVLEKLKGEGRVRKTEDGKWFVGEGVDGGKL